jgi:hypothetical protein
MTTPPAIDGQTVASEQLAFTLPAEPRCKACKDHGEVAVMIRLPSGNPSFRLERCECTGFLEDPGSLVPGLDEPTWGEGGRR